MNPRTRHLIALVEGGATLQDAGHRYGITRERVRQILKLEGISAGALPNRGESTSARRLAIPEEAPSSSQAAALRDELEQFKGDLRAGGLRESTIHSYLSGATLFVRWLAGEYKPSGSGRQG